MKVKNKIVNREIQYFKNLQEKGKIHKKDSMVYLSPLNYRILSYNNRNNLKALLKIIGQLLWSGKHQLPLPVRRDSIHLLSCILFQKKELFRNNLRILIVLSMPENRVLILNRKYLKEQMRGVQLCLEKNNLKWVEQ